MRNQPKAMKFVVSRSVITIYFCQGQHTGRIETKRSKNTEPFSFLLSSGHSLMPAMKCGI